MKIEIEDYANLPARFGFVQVVCFVFLMITLFAVAFGLIIMFS